MLVLLLALVALQAPPESAAAPAGVKLAPGSALRAGLWRCVALPWGGQAPGGEAQAARPLAAILPQAGAGRVIHCAVGRTEAAAPRPAADLAPHQAGLVIDFGGGRVATYCIEVGAGGQVSGMELLRSSGLPIVVEASGGLGGAVCKIGDVGSNFPSEPCFAQCTLQPGAACVYWSYSRLDGGSWRSSQLGPSSTTVRAGDVDGWAWGAGTTGQGAQPPPVTFAALCAADAATATATPSPTATPPATATPSPTQQVIAIPAATATPSPPATATATATQAAAAAVTETLQPTPTATAAAAPTPPPTAEPATPAATPIAAATEAPAQPTAAPATVEASATPAAIAAAATERPAGGAGQIWLPLAPPEPPAAGATSAPYPAPSRAAATEIPAVPQTPAAISVPAPRAGGPAPAEGPPQSYLAFAGLAAFLIAALAFVRRRGP